MKGMERRLSTLIEQRQQLGRVFRHSPSLRRYAREILAEVYSDVVVRAAAETGLWGDL